MDRRKFLKTAGLGAASLVIPGCIGKPELSGGKACKDRPNIIFIMADDHASHALSCYGSSINKTPNLDRLANEGMRFDNCFCTNSICAPSRAVILTGKYSHLNGVIDNLKRFDGGQVTFPKLLQQAGYETAMVGKWHLKSEPKGFDYWNVLPGQGKYHNPQFIEMGQRKRYTGYVTDLITDFCLDWLKQRKSDKPFCLMYHHKAPHRNWQPDEKHAKMYDNVDIPVPETFDDDYKTRSNAALEQEMTIAHHLRVPGDTKIKPPEGLTGRDLEHWKYQRYIKDYLRCVASIDDNVGRLLKYLDESGLTENTVVVYTSDQGFFLGDHGWFDKRFIYEESLRMPLLVRYPKEIKSGSVNRDIVLNLDFAPTFLGFAGVAVPADMQGRSFRSLLGGKTPKDWRTSMYYHYYEYPIVHMVKRHYGVRTKRYKLIHFYYDIDAWELYDLQKDPNELNNLYGDPAYASITAQLRTELKRLRSQYGDSDELAQEFLHEFLEERRKRKEATKKK
ncbi:MAG: sulfatase/phosphatase domain-containing protein [Planctomycetota bacterium]|jgi:arylsulfatase A-like enzyme